MVKDVSKIPTVLNCTKLKKLKFKNNNTSVSKKDIKNNYNIRPLHSAFKTIYLHIFVSQVSLARLYWTRGSA